MLECALLTDFGTELSESPVWNSKSGSLFYVDLLAGTVHEYNVHSKLSSRLEFDYPIGAIALRHLGGLVVAGAHGFEIVHLDGSREYLGGPEQVAQENRMNDGKCDPWGRFWAGTMAYDWTPGAGSLYCLEPDWTWSKKLENISLSNGLAWSPDGHVMYYVDSLARSVDTFRFDGERGALTNRQTLVRILPKDGLPDGLAVDIDGFIWVALHGGGAIHRFSPNGDLDYVLNVPVSDVTSCCFGGPNMEDLFITTSRYGMNEEVLQKQPDAGKVFVAHGVPKGLPAGHFGG